MSEKKTYLYYLNCKNCKYTIVLNVPFGIPVDRFICEDSLSPCSRCGCNPISATPPSKK